MIYQYYPGCSLEGTALEYNLATRAVMEAAGAQLHEIKDWTCCGASAAEATSLLLSLALPARNLALAEQADDVRDILVPCSACYLNLKKVEEKTHSDSGLREQLNGLLEQDGLQLAGTSRVRHLLDVMANDIGAEKICSLVKQPLTGLTVAPYYGCQCLRPYAIFDDPEAPRSMEPLIAAAGATVYDWDMGGRCCGASHMNTHPEVGQALVGAILAAAAGADAIATVCPMCQMNLEAYQNQISRQQGRDLHLTIVYLPQLIGLAMQLPLPAVGLNLNLAVDGVFRSRQAI